MLATLPNFDSLIDTAGNNEGMRPVKVDGGAKVRVRVQPLAAPPVRDVPNADRFVVAGRQQVLAAGMPGQTANPVVVA